MQKLLGMTIFSLSALIGVVAFIYPFFLPTLAARGVVAQDSLSLTPALTVFLLVFALAVLLLETQGQKTSAKMIAALGVLVAATSVLRFIEVAIPGPGGFSPIFVPIIIAGYVFGARFGFLMGTLTLFVSALLTGGVGPWLPYQMFAAGWVGLTAGWLPQIDSPPRQLAMLVLFAVVWGLLYGFIMNLYIWPFLAPGVNGGFDPQASLAAVVAGYGTFYVATSLVWDVTRAAGNAVLMLAVGLPAVRALERFRDRFNYEVVVQ